MGNSITRLELIDKRLRLERAVLRAAKHWDSSDGDPRRLTKAVKALVSFEKKTRGV